MNSQVQVTPRKRKVADAVTPLTPQSNRRTRGRGPPTPNPPLAPFPTPPSSRTRKAGAFVPQHLDEFDEDDEEIPSSSKRASIKPLPAHLQTLLTLHHAFNLALSLHIATKPPILPPHPPSTTLLPLPCLTNYLAIRETVERTGGRRFTTQDLARLAWLWQWDGETLPAETAAVGEDKGDDENPFLVKRDPLPQASEPDDVVSAMSYLITATRTLDHLGKRVGTYGLGIELDLKPGETRQMLHNGAEGGLGNKGQGGGMGAVGRWNNHGEERMDRVRAKLHKWVELHGGYEPPESVEDPVNNAYPTPSTGSSTGTRSPIPPIPLMRLPLPTMQNTLLSGIAIHSSPSTASTATSSSRSSGSGFNGYSSRSDGSSSHTASSRTSDGSTLVSDSGGSMRSGLSGMNLASNSGSRSSTLASEPSTPSSRYSNAMDSVGTRTSLNELMQGADMLPPARPVRRNKSPFNINEPDPFLVDGEVVEIKAAPKAGSIEARRQAMQDRIRKRKEEARRPTPMAASLHGSYKVNMAGLSAAAKRQELQRRATLSRLESVAEAVWMMFSAPGTSSSSTGSIPMTPPSVIRRKTMRLDEVAEIVVKSSKTPISHAEAESSLGMLVDLCPFFLVKKVVAKAEYLEMPTHASSSSPATTSTSSPAPSLRSQRAVTPPAQTSSAGAVPSSPSPSPRARGRLTGELAGPASPGRVRRSGGLREVRERIRRELELGE